MTANEGRRLPRGIRLAVFDVDGVLTDGRFYLSNEGVESKAFSTQDGYGLKRLLAAGVDVAVISSRSSQAVALRMAELGIRHVVQGARDKVAAFEKLTGELQLSAEQCVYVGDDIPDLPLLRRAGYAIAVANAVEEVRQACDYTTHSPGGAGAVREICDLLTEACTTGRANET